MPFGDLEKIPLVNYLVCFFLSLVKWEIVIYHCSQKMTAQIYNCSILILKNTKLLQ